MILDVCNESGSSNLINGDLVGYEGSISFSFL